MAGKIIGAVTAFAIGVGATATILAGNAITSGQSWAQPAPEQMDRDGPPPPPGHGGPGGPEGFGPHGPTFMHPHGPMDGPPMEPGMLALVYPHGDRRLSAADVQTIAQAFLLWNGNHDWKVIDVKPIAQHGAPAPAGPDHGPGPGGPYGPPPPRDEIGFSVATANGAVIASFAMDPHTGHVRRVS